MKKALIGFGLVGLFLLITAFTLGNTSSIEGKWVGSFAGTAGSIPVRTHFWMENDEYKGTMDFPQENIYGVKLSWIIVESPSVHFEVVKNNEALAFDGKIISNQLVGEFSTKTGRGVFGLSRESTM